MRVTNLVKAMQCEYRGVADTVITPRTKTDVWSENIKGKTYSLGLRIIPGAAEGLVTVLVTRFTDGLINRIEPETCENTIESLRDLITNQINLYRDMVYVQNDYLLELELSRY